MGLTRFVTNRGGTFDVEVDGTLIYSKALTGRHTNPGEVLGLFRDFVGAETPVYER
jgi:selenoprotein W-related protein